ncbi:hypothetical protein N7519_000424 [Penicillium mononematosum]|uniref:uncharacterized protein n=1 Tax=Penicillium mononematosum TaxID=268346 RepID=UPI0025492896|nr:uncharacterized protein N7519_000424 [Penicillium mononematosum]KAJ6190403.1 hypothetical protein N7519_000424 [Penicillium mononematosum]
MAGRKKSNRAGKAPIVPTSNGFTTERAVGGERRSIRHYHDGRVSQREPPMLPAVRTLTDSKVISRKGSSRALSNTQSVPKPKEEEYRSPTLAEIEKLSGAVTNIFQPGGSKPFEKIPKETENIPEETETPETWSCDSSYGMITPPLPVDSPMPEDSPELMSTEVFPLPVTSNPGNSDEDADTISRQWADLSGKDRTGRSDIYD